MGQKKQSNSTKRRKKNQKKKKQLLGGVKIRGGSSQRGWGVIKEGEVEKGPSQESNESGKRQKEEQGDLIVGRHIKCMGKGCGGGGGSKKKRTGKPGKCSRNNQTAKGRNVSPERLKEK